MNTDNGPTTAHSSAHHTLVIAEAVLRTLEPHHLATNPELGAVIDQLADQAIRLRLPPADSQ